MTSVADCLRQHAPAYLQAFGDSMPLNHRKVLSAICRCRTGELGNVLYHCDSCGREHWVGRSCGNRHCPNCGKGRPAVWLEQQAERLLPVHHFLVTFTAPEPLRAVLRRNQRAGYAALFDAAAASLRDVAAATRSLRGCQLGFFGVLHTWGRDPTVYHPHVHFVVPGGGVRADEDQPQWQATPENFLVHHGTLIRVYKAKLAAQLRAAGLDDELPEDTWSQKSVVDIEPVGDGRATLKYLAPYVNRVAICDSRIVACDEASVTFRYTPSGSRQSKMRTVTGLEFVRGFLQHTLPRGFQKIRYYGWMSGNSRLGLDQVKWLVCLMLGWTYWLASTQTVDEPDDDLAFEPGVARCPGCGRTMRVIAVTDQPRAALPEHSIAYLDSG
jgi:hypothetical protein